MKRAISIIILVSMTLHCFSRLGIISYLYHSRHKIAYNIGLIAEIPVAMCNQDYFARHAPLVVHEVDLDDSTMPVQFASAREINLFFQIAETAIPANICSSELIHHTGFPDQKYDPPLMSIFHPPC